MIIYFSNLVNQKYSLDFIRRLFSKLEIPGSYFVAKDILYVPISGNPKKPKGQDCWSFTGYLPNDGYGRIWYKGKYHRMHRIMYDLFNGDLLPNLFVLHSCDNPMCANNAHLSQGTHKKNMDDRNNKDRQASGVDNARHKFTVAQVLEIWDDFHAGNCTKKELAQRYGGCQETISDIVNGKSWIRTLKNNGRL